MFSIAQQKRELREQERQVSAALATHNITDYGTGYYDATYRRAGFTIILSGQYLYHLADDGKLVELFACCSPDCYTPSPVEFATLLDGLFTNLQEAGRE